MEPPSTLSSWGSSSSESRRSHRPTGVTRGSLAHLEQQAVGDVRASRRSSSCRVGVDDHAAELQHREGPAVDARRAPGGTAPGRGWTACTASGDGQQHRREQQQRQAGDDAVHAALDHALPALEARLLDRRAAAAPRTAGCAAAGRRPRSGPGRPAARCRVPSSCQDSWRRYWAAVSLAEVTAMVSAPSRAAMATTSSRPPDRDAGHVGHAGAVGGGHARGDDVQAGVAAPAAAAPTRSSDGAAATDDHHALGAAAPARAAGAATCGPRSGRAG